jgi:choline dehydrogenase-like flavoprotein
MLLREVDAVIVGAGAGGPVVAQELSLAGWKVVLLERGDWTKWEDIGHDELWSQRAAALGAGFGPPNAGNVSW